MFNKILIAVDSSNMGQKVFQEGLSIAKINEAEVLLLHVLSAEEENSPLPIPPDITEFYPAAGNELTLENWREQWEIYQHKGLEMLEQYVEKAQKQGVNVKSEQIAGSPGKTICKVAQENKTELIVIGHRGLRGLSELLLGSVSNYVLHHAQCSVLMVQKKDLTVNSNQSSVSSN
jgi:nucleotide-binding universal stress UspA family protein